MKPWKIWIDTGGTFTDCIAVTPEGETRRLKVLSSGLLRLRIISQQSPDHFIVQLPQFIDVQKLIGYTVTITGRECKITGFDTLKSGITVNHRFRKINSYVVEITTHEEVPVFAARLLTGTTLQDPFPELQLRLGSTRGTNALLERKGAQTLLLITKGFRDLLVIGTQQREELFALNIQKEAPLYHDVIEVHERIEANGHIHFPLTSNEIERVVLKAKRMKAKAIAIAFMNSYRYPQHEQQLAQALMQAGFNYVSLSHQLSSQIKFLPRAATTVANAYLDPIIRQYVSRIQNGLNSKNFQIMSSAGGLLGATDFQPKDSLLSGPAGGVIGAMIKGRESGENKIITFDMGGTSTDVSLCDERVDYKFECAVGNQKILSPSIAIETIAAGGGSICSYDGFRLIVGPHSAGATPGPACYGAGGPLTITDVNLLLGRLDEDNFSIPISTGKAEKAFEDVRKNIQRKSKRKIHSEIILDGFVQIANEKMAEAIRKVSLRKGFRPSEFSLLCFGGAGGQHACSLASMLSMTTILVPYDAGLLSAYGIGHASVEKVKEKLVLQPLNKTAEKLDEWFQDLFEQADKELRGARNAEDIIEVRNRLLFMRLKGQETSLEVPYTSEDAIIHNFKSIYKNMYGHWIDDRPIEIESIRLVAAVHGDVEQNQVSRKRRYSPKPFKKKKIFSKGLWQTANVYRWEDFLPGANIKGPSLVISNNATFFVENSWSFFLNGNNTGIVRLEQMNAKSSKKTFETELTLFTNRFTSIAENMGALLQRTSFSVNVKERLDFSCALLDEHGYLIVNAPHIPVHLGSLGVCVRSLLKTIEMKEGDVVITNHPVFGGSHLPDVTMVMPVYYKKRRIGFAANRAHHAEIGGKQPGSMPADATLLEEEGVIIQPQYVVHNGKARWAQLSQVLTQAKYPSRAVEENIADMQAGLASLIFGASALHELCENEGIQSVKKFMGSIKDLASRLTAEKIRTLPQKYFAASEHLDDGTVLKASVQKVGRKLIIDFTGTSSQHPGNLNATPAIVQSVVLYVLRLWINQPVPLNEGIMDRITLVIPKSLLNPNFSGLLSPAVVGGNTEVSQRLTDTLLKALNLSACSQGTMNNFLFGNDSFGYYETICGGTGAGAGFNGADAVHQHMTNTRITDPEIMELNYPVRLERFELRKNSGGKGMWKGGDGIIREVCFKEILHVNLLTQHRKVAPYGLKGGEPGMPGEQFIIQNNGNKQKLKGICSLTVHKGDRIVIKTPGGGGWGQLSR